MNNKNVKFLDNLGDHDYLYVGLANRDNTYKIKKKDLKIELGISDVVQPLVYIAILQQSGTNAPTAKVIRNDFSGDIVWTRVNMGIYEGTLGGTFTEDKTFVSNGTTYLGSAVETNYYYGTDKVTIRTAVLSGLPSLSDNILDEFTIKIEVYP